MNNHEIPEGALELYQDVRAHLKRYFEYIKDSEGDSHELQKLEEVAMGVSASKFARRYGNMSKYERKRLRDFTERDVRTMTDEPRVRIAAILEAV